MKFILNDQEISTDQPPGTTVLDFVRYHKNLKGTKIGCREGDCGACTILVGELIDDQVRYRTMTSCLMPLANAAGLHIVTIEGINPADGSLTPVQQAMVDESGTQCGFCTVGFVMSLTGFCLDISHRVSSPHVSKGSPRLFEAAVSSIDGNICRCTGYKSIERAAACVSEQLAVSSEQFVPDYFTGIALRLKALKRSMQEAAVAERNTGTSYVPETRPVGSVRNLTTLVAGGTDIYVQRPDSIVDEISSHVFYDDALRGIRDGGEFIEIGASATVTDVLESDVMNAVFPDLYKHLKLVSSTPIRNMATLAGNFVNASPIGDMTVWFLALGAEIDLASTGGDASVNERADDAVGTLPNGRVSARRIKLRDLYLGYKQLAKQPDEIITTIRFKKPTGDFRFNFEKVCKRTCLDIATVNTAISLSVSSPHVSKGAHKATGALPNGRATDTIVDAHLAAGGVAPIPLYLKETSEFLRGKEVTEEIIAAANEIMQSEISPISDVRGTESYKRLLLRQLFRAHFVELFKV